MNFELLLFVAAALGAVVVLGCTMLVLAILFGRIRAVFEEEGKG